VFSRWRSGISYFERPVRTGPPAYAHGGIGSFAAVKKIHNSGENHFAAWIGFAIR
jgi:hypothetical protein